MVAQMNENGTRALVGRLLQATNDHDIEALVACFAEEYRNETPAHPARSFSGRSQVRRNWEQIFGFVADLHAEVLSSAIDGDRAWTEWEMTGTRRDGTPHRMRGVVIFDIGEGLARSARFYLEPVDEGPGTADDAVRDQVARR
jgi:ketosteroid isomerase-like protein